VGALAHGITWINSVTAEHARRFRHRAQEPAMNSIGTRTKPRMATAIPASVTIPNRVDTRLGQLHFFDGFPDEETVQRLYDNLDVQRAVHAFLTAMPAASLSAMRDGLRSIGVNNTTVAIFETLMDSRSLFLTANTESIYTVGWLDLKDGPLVVETPPNVLGLIDDFWFHYVCDVGNAGPDEGEGGKFLLLPPAYRGEVPAGYHVFRSNTYGNWLLIRGFMVDGDPAPAIRRIKSTLRIYPLAQAARPPHTYFVNASGLSFNTIHATDSTFFEAVNRVVQEEPAIAIDAETLGLLASIGIEKGKPFAPDARMTQILQHAAVLGNATARAMSYQSRLPEQYLFDDRHYISPFVGGSHEFLRGGARLLDPRIGRFFSATGSSPAMAMRLPACMGSQYATAYVDHKGCAFDGGRTYRLHLPPKIPARDFWSIVVYDTQTRSMLTTDQQFPSISSHRPAVAINRDASVDVYFGPKPLRGKRSNWIQTIPGKGWFFMLRLYGPLESWFDKTWQPEDVEELPEVEPVEPEAATLPRMSTLTPPAIGIADRIDTPIGTLRFSDGVPDQATVEKVYDNIDFQRGVQAFLTTIPAASMRAIREGIRSFGPDNDTAVIFENLVDAKSLFLTQNTDSPCALAWIDLRHGPVVIESPADTIGLVDDFWFRYVADLGNAGLDRGAGGKYLFLPPDYIATPPDGYFVFRSRTFNIGFATRSALVTGDPRPAADNIKAQLRIYPLSKAATPPALTFVNASGRSFNTIHASDFSFFEHVNDVVQEEPADAMDPETLGLLASIGIEKGKPFAPDARMKTILTEAAYVAHATARAITYRTRMKEAYFSPDSAWQRVFVGGNHEFLRNGARLFDARTMFHFYATGITPTMAVKVRAGVGWQDAVAFVDARGQPLDGGTPYRLHLPPGIPAKEGWSVVLYDNQTRSQLQTDQRFPSLISQKAGVVVNEDTSVDIHFGPKAPPGARNWIQTCPGKGWNVILRLYGPLQPWFDQTWRPGEIEQV
jgi:hypothetical protein